MTKNILYKGNIYTVTQPGELVYSKTKTIGSRSKLPQILDQLNNLSEITQNRIGYLKSKYNLTELDYYIIVVLEGDETKLPKCEYKNPKTGEICNKPKEFRSLSPKENQRKPGTRLGIFKEGCHDHIQNRAAQIKQQICYSKGITGLQKADRKSKIWRDKLSKHARKQIAEGNSIFSPDEVRKENILSAKELNNISEMNKKINYLTLTKEEKIIADRDLYLSKGNLTDICYYYISFLEGNNDIFKLGVTIDIDKRKSLRDYHGFSYKDIHILFSTTRDIISDFEYKVKLNFINDISLGNEGFPISKIKEILDFIEKFANSINIKLNDCNLYEKIQSILDKL